MVAVAIVILLATYLRFAALVNTAVDTPIRADARDYVLYALNLNIFGTYSRSDSGFRINSPPTPDAVRSPGYPLFLSLFLHEPGEAEFRKALFAQTLLSCFTVLLTYWIARMVLSHGAALAATTLTAVSPHLINANIYVLTESFFSFLVILFIWLAAQAARSGRLWYWGLAGAVLAAAALTRPIVLYFPFVVVMLILLHYPRRKSAAVALCFVTGFVLTYSPWAARNLLVTGEMSDPTLLNNFLHHGMYPDFKYDDSEESYAYPYRFDPDSQEIAKSTTSVLSEIAERAHDEPARYLRWYLLGKPVALLSWDLVQAANDIFVYPVTRTPYADRLPFVLSNHLSRWLHWPLMVLALLYCVLWYPQHRKQSLDARDDSLVATILFGLLMYFIATHMVGAPFPRYAVPIRPVTYILALAGAMQLLNLRTRTGKSGR